MRTCLIVLILACAACAVVGTAPQVSPAVPPGSGLVFVYLEPLPPEAAGLRIEVGSIGAVGGDGAVHPLPIDLPVLDASEPQRQRLLGVGAVPAGSYRGIEIRIASARLGAGPGELALGEPTRRAELSFPLADQQAVAIRLAMARDVPVVRGHDFQPEFTAGVPRATELAPNATAVATVGSTSTLAVFHKVSGEIFDVLRTGAGPRGVAYDPERQRAYVACSDAAVIESFDLARGLRDESLPLLLDDQPSGLALSPDGLTLVVANAGSNTVSVIDAPSLTERVRVTVGREPVAALLEPSGQRAVVFQFGDDSLGVVDLLRGVLVGTIVVDNGPEFGAFDPRGEKLYVIHRNSPFLLAVDLLNLRVVARHYVGSGARAIAVDPRNGRVFLSRSGVGRLEVFDPSSLLPIQTVAAGADATYLTIDRETEQLLAAVPSTGQVPILRLSGAELTATAEVGGAVRWIDVAGGSRGGP